MEKRALIAVALSIAVLIVYQILVVNPRLDKTRLQQQAQMESAANKEISQSMAVATATPSSPPLFEEEKKDVFGETYKSDISQVQQPKTIMVDTPLYQAIFTTRGALLESFKLKNYGDDGGKEVNLLSKGSKVPALAMGDSRDFTFSKYIFTTTTEKDIKLGESDSTRLVFTLIQDGVKIRRTYVLYGSSCKIDLKDETAGLREYYITTGSDFGIYGTGGIGTHVGGAILQEAERIEFSDDDDLTGVSTYMGNISWIAQEDKYFFAAIIPESRKDEALAWKREGEIIVALRTTRPVNKMTIYAGPKKYEELKKIDENLVDIIDFGFFSIISWPIFWMLLFLDSFIKNYGWSIILLTIIIRIPFIPLINKGQSSMKKLQTLKPMMDEIRERFKKDPQRMQKEMMELYRKHKVNPMGGCLPILIQIPVFFALYKVLLMAIELRGAPWLLWIQDLSAKDPYYVLPVIMGASMFLQQKMTPTSMDPTQAKIMTFMPIIFTFMFLSFPSGLVLYWLVSNILSIIQQYYVNKKPE